MITKPKGCYDLTGRDSKLYKQIVNVVNEYATVYDYKYVRTPLFESSELFKRGVGESSDIVQKETYDACYYGCCYENGWRKNKSFQLLGQCKRSY